MENIEQSCPINGLNRIPFRVLEAFYRFEHFVILGHQKPDADCAASQLALCLALQRLGKSVQPVSAGPFLRPELHDLAAKFDSEINQQKIAEFNCHKVLAVILDCSTVERTGFAKELEGLFTLVIDHHASGKVDGNLQYCDPTSPSSSILVQNILLQLPLFLFQMAPQHYYYLMQEDNQFIDQEIAAILFLGFATDTGFFRFLKPENGGDILRLVSTLVDTKINLQDIYLHMTGGRVLETRRILGLLLLRAGFLLDARLCVSYSLLEDKKFWYTESSDSDSFYTLSLATQNCEVIVLLDESEKGYWNVGLRSLKQHDVGSIAAQFGGGGHKNASGCRIKTPHLGEALNLVLQEIIRFWVEESKNTTELHEYITTAPKFLVDQFA